MGAQLMSTLTGTGTELLYSNIAVGGGRSSFTTEAVINQVANMIPSARIPTDYWLPEPSEVGRSITIIARGIFRTSASPPAYTIRVRAGSSQSTAGPILLGMTSATPVLTASMTAIHWELRGDVTLEAIGASGANSTVRGVGMFACGNVPSGPSTFPVYGAAASPGTVSIDTSINNYITVTAQSSVSNSTNTVTLHQLLILGNN